MSKKAQQVYKKMIDDAAGEMLIEVNKKAFDITEDVFNDILLSLREKIDELLERKGIV